MPEAVATNHNEFEGLTLGELVDLRYRTDEERKALDRQSGDLKKQVERIDQVLLSYSEDNPQVAQLNGDQAKIVFTENERYDIDGGERWSVARWLFEHNLEHLMVYHMNKAATREVVSLHGGIPHVTHRVEKKVKSARR